MNSSASSRLKSIRVSPSSAKSTATSPSMEAKSRAIFRPRKLLQAVVGRVFRRNRHRQPPIDTAEIENRVPNPPCASDLRSSQAGDDDAMLTSVSMSNPIYESTQNRKTANATDENPYDSFSLPVWTTPPGRAVNARKPDICTCAASASNNRFTALHRTSHIAQSDTSIQPLVNLPSRENGGKHSVKFSASCGWRTYSKKLGTTVTNGAQLVWRLCDNLQ